VVLRILTGSGASSDDDRAQHAPVRLAGVEQGPDPVVLEVAEPEADPLDPLDQRFPPSSLSAETDPGTSTPRIRRGPAAHSGKGGRTTPVSNVGFVGTPIRTSPRAVRGSSPAASTTA